MAWLAVRGLLSRKLRGALTAFAILLGVGMIAGTLMLNASVAKSFDDIFATASSGVDVDVRPKLDIKSSFDIPEAGTALPGGMRDRVRAVDGVKQAIGAINDVASIAILDESGDRIGPSQGGPPHIVNSVEPEPFSPFTYTDGEPPSTAHEVAIDSITADEQAYEIGQSVTITGTKGARDYTLSGIARFGSGIPLGGASLATFTLPEAQRITDKRGSYDEILVQADDGVSADELVSRVNAALPPDVVARTGEQVAKEDSQEIKDGFSFFTTALLVFAGISLFVGAFLIFNTFSITVAQRTREFGMLRTLGASARQVLWAVIFEALVLGAIASAIGILAGVGFVGLVTSLFKALGFELPQSGLVIDAPTIVIPLAVGIVATLGSALMPALRATRVTPLEALRDDGGQGGEGARGRRRTIVATVLLTAALAALLGGLFATGSFSSALPLLGAGLILLFVGVAMIGGRMIKPLASIVGRPIERLRGVTGRLARENTLRNPSRTATTSAALMIGVALVVFAIVFVSALTKSIDDALDKTFVGDLTIYNVDGFSPIPPKVADAVSGLEGVQSASPIAGAGGKLKGDDNPQIVTGLDPATITDAGNLDWVDGSDAVLTDLGPADAIVESDWAADNGIAVGDQITMTAPDGHPLDLHVAGSIRDRISLIVQSAAVPIDTLRSEFDSRQDFADLVSFVPGADFDATRERVDQLLASKFPNAESRSQQELKDEQRQQTNQLLGLILVLLSLSIVVSLFGVVNTLVLTVYERTRELGMLRAIGASRGQIRRMIRYESMITALIGAIVGAVIGVGIAVAAVKALESEGLILSIPAGEIVAVVVLAGIAGVLAGIWPARRASKIEVMAALQYE